jgi:hypothetical protein
VSYTVTTSDPDLFEARERGGQEALDAALAQRCTCGHTRAEHFAATGALGSVGGTACEACWTCGTFTASATCSPDYYGGEDVCTHCNGEGLCMDGADPLHSCPDEPHRCHACGGSGDRKHQVIF